MFDFITDSIENTLDITDKILSGEDISKRQVAKLISDGVTIAGTMATMDAASELLKKLIDDSSS